MKILILTAVAFFALTGKAKADHIEDRNFLTTEFAKADAQTVYSQNDRINALTPDQVTRFQHVAHEQAQIWGDTILEGDYQADGQTTLDQVEELKIEGQLIAFKITYSERSWDTSICPSNDESHASLAQCEEGRIIESSFVSPDMGSWTRDPENFATFEAK